MPNNNQKKSNKSNHKEHKGLTESQKLDVRQILEDIYLVNRWRITVDNFLRGIAFGLGSFLGGTVIVAISIWIFSKTVDLSPTIKSWTNEINQARQ